MTWKSAGPKGEDLAGLRVLVVEDEPLIALDLVTALTERGAEVVGPGRDLEENLTLAREPRLAAALLDVRLGQNATFAPLAQQLHDRGVPFAFYTGQAKFDDVCRRWPKAPLVQKPAPTWRLVAVLESLCKEPPARSASEAP